MNCTCDAVVPGIKEEASGLILEFTCCERRGNVMDDVGDVQAWHARAEGGEYNHLMSLTASWGMVRWVLCWICEMMENENEMKDCVNFQNSSIFLIKRDISQMPNLKFLIDKQEHITNQLISNFIMCQNHDFTHYIFLSRKIKFVYSFLKM